jgi:hypothetical protein
MKYVVAVRKKPKSWKKQRLSFGSKKAAEKAARAAVRDGAYSACVLYNSAGFVNLGRCYFSRK